MDLFRVRLNCIDHYQATPSRFDPQLRNNVAPSQRHNEPKVPVIRVFGSTETGQKVCAHIHGAFPYLYIEYNGSLVADEGVCSLCDNHSSQLNLLTYASVGAYIHRLHLSIDHALGVTYRRNVYDGKSKFVTRITLVKGVPFYGYHVGNRYYLKIYMLNPMVMTRLADLLRQGVIMKKIFQPFEAHLQYLLQWMTDYNLYGCGYIDCQKAYFRYPVPDYEEMEDSSHLWHDRSIPSEYLLKEGSMPRVSHCPIEVDICVQDILNRAEIKARPIHQNLREQADPQAPTEKLVHSMAGLWRDETRRRKSRMIDPDPGSSPFPPEVMVSMSAESRNSQKGVWIHEEEYMEKVQSLIVEENANSDSDTLSFDSPVKQLQMDDHVPTVFESVEDLYPENLGPALGLKMERETLSKENSTKNEEVEVDENQILNLDNHEINDFPYDSDEDVMREIELSQRKLGDQVDARESDDPDLHNSGQLSAVDASLSQNMEIYAGKNIPSTNTKRSRAVVDDLREYPKRQRIKMGTVAPEEIESDEDHDEVILRKSTKRNATYSKDTSIPGGIDHTSGLLSTVNGVSHRASKAHVMVTKKSSQELLKPNLPLGSHPLGFPVVKDPQDPSTILKLSQGIASVKSLSSSPKKHLSFGFNLPLVSPHSQKPGHLPNSSTKSDASSASGALSTALRNIKHSFAVPDTLKFYAFAEKPPSALDVVASMQVHGLHQMIYQDAYYSNEEDVPERPREWAGREFKLGSSTVPFLPLFDPTGSSSATYGEKQGIVLDKQKEESLFQKRRRLCGLRSWEIGEPPPSHAEVSLWLMKEDGPTNLSADEGYNNTSYSHIIDGMNRLSQIEEATQRRKHGFKFTQKQAATSVKHEANYMSTMSLEIHVNTRGKFVPNPEEDEIQSLFWCLQSNEDGLQSNGLVGGTHVGIVVLSEDGVVSNKISRQVDVEVQEETSELDLLIRMVEIVRSHDPDILTGYEVHGASWGYLIERARIKYDYNLCDEFSRMKSQSHGRFGKDNDKWGFNTTSTISITGRHMINIWRAMRSELNLLQYTMENVVFHLLHRRIPHYSWHDLTVWYSNGRPGDLAKVVDYYVSRVQLDLAVLEQNELIPRTSEQARLLGVDFFSVFSRGSQFKVESLMFRIAKPENFLLVSPSRKQVGGQNALECLPLVMEPQSAFYNSPLLVLDFQSLYPSVMIAYNYCYSTFLGRIVNWRGTNKMGFTEYKRQEKLLELLKDHINIAPNGMMYVKPEIRKSLLAKMLGEILETRVMVKSGMKIDKDDKTLQRLLNNRQLALKLIANVTYGYTSASFSGRMPCSEIADSIVQTGRESLERAIALIHSVKSWGAEVVYGDTDSLFVYLKGRSKDQAFDIGNEIAKTITNMSPRPVKLKFEKVYFPCVLLAKKRYVGYKYESKDQQVPEFDAKGIETVRRDGTPAEQKIEEKALKILFRSADLSQVKSYFQTQCEKIMRGSVSIQDFCFAREVRLGTYSDKGPPPPGALISTKRMLEDARAEPQYGERVPYVVITGAPGARLIDRCVAPETLLHSSHNELDSEYYISKNLIPPLERIFNLVGANVRNWYDEMPKVQRIRRVDANLQLLGESKELPTNKKTLESYLKSSSCLVCRGKLESEGSICDNCLANRPTSLLTLRMRLSKAEKKTQDLERVCQSCSGITFLDEVKCDSRDCPVFYTRTKQRANLMSERAATEPVMKVLETGIDGVDLDDLEW
jgi:DNA polymerase zeta